MEAIIKGQNEKKEQFPKIITWSQCWDTGLGAAIQNASSGRAPVLIFADLSPFTIAGEMRGSRTEYIHWIQDVPDQKLIVGQYGRFTSHIKTGNDIKQMVDRALQFACSIPADPVYLTSARDVSY
ncbi:uncharacterized protein RCO7_07228 [Rhynchosporium graminicola]|uniref:Uncharacterized protein n=1 Tax=Rhynchosporium graminicola TaxID=2792576 RepID=A0A1E1L8D7_9HELO|nr:uncharacterized protein RCO7_07228 [Rhynchosporium commune]